MKRYIFIFLLIWSCSSISDKVTIDSKDYSLITKEVEHNYLYSELEKTDFYYDREFFKLLGSMQYEFDDIVVTNFAETLPNLIIKRLKISNEKIIEMYKLKNINPLVYNYLSLFEMKREDYHNAYNNAWISKSASPTYLADEIFMYISILTNEKEKVEEILVDMEKNFKDYPLNKYNRIFYNHLYNTGMIKEEDFGLARIEIRNINKKFYPELQGYKVNYLMMIDLLQAQYYFVKKDNEALIKMKEEINKTDIRYKLDLRKINEFIDERIEYLKRF
ncbi:hypothetical protein [Streptobacillus moniliformis]|uniref:hypothetical protein n=1 Tax=Streptobacillus moniliformis TaxID=34105 RepID=UPI0007EEF4BB|nr:hypothetical protein [Streptobacillus moniliformis]